MATLSVATIIRAGIVPAYTSCSAGGDKFTNDGKTFVHLRNTTSNATRTVTFVTPKTISGLGVADHAVTMSAASERIVGPFPKDTFNSTSGFVAMTYSAVTNLTVQARKISAT